MIRVRKRSITFLFGLSICFSVACHSPNQSVLIDPSDLPTEHQWTPASDDISHYRGGHCALLTIVKDGIQQGEVHQTVLTNEVGGTLAEYVSYFATSAEATANFDGARDRVSRCSDWTELGPDGMPHLWEYDANSMTEWLPGIRSFSIRAATRGLEAPAQFGAIATFAVQGRAVVALIHSGPTSRVSLSTDEYLELTTKAIRRLEE